MLKSSRVKEKALAAQGAEPGVKPESNIKEYLHDSIDADARSPILLSGPEARSSNQRPARSMEQMGYTDPYQARQAYEYQQPSAGGRQVWGSAEEGDMGYGGREGGVSWPEPRPAPAQHPAAGHGRNEWPVSNRMERQ